MDLNRAGVYRYAEDPTTDVLCMAYAFDDEEPELWVPGDQIPDRIARHVAGDGELRAWNAAFERIVWRTILGPGYGFPVPRLEQWVCTAAEAAAMALPRSLAATASVLRVPQQKDDDGHRLMLQLSRPRSRNSGVITWWEKEDHPEKFRRLYEYCRQDVRTERAIAQRLRRLSDAERQIYLADQRMNDRGVLLDMRLVRAARAIAAEGVRRANTQLTKITDGGVTAVTQIGRLTAWLRGRDDAPAIPDLRKSTVRDFLSGELPDDVREILEVRAEAGKSSVAKLDAMEACVCKDGRARGLVLYHGASTGRWVGRLIQPQNFPRGTVDHPERFIERILAGEYDLIDVEAPALSVISSLLRGMFVASPGCRLIVGDYAQIEARVLAWIAEQDDLMEAFRAGAKVYERMAARIYRRPVEEIAKGSVERQIGKMTVLGCGYQMGWTTFRDQTREQTGIALTDEEAQTAVSAYREMNDRIVQFWYDINRAAIRAVARPGEVTAVGRNGKIRYVVRGQFLWCILPSGRPLAYARPCLEQKVPRWGGEPRKMLRYTGVNSYTRKWGPQYAYGGLLTENVVQAMARDLLADAMLRLEKAGYPPVLSVHDELGADVPENHGSVEEFAEIMRTTPAWAAGCPVEVEAWEGSRYRK